MLKRKNYRFSLLFSHLLDKIFTFGKENKFSMRSLTQIFRTFDFIEGTHARKNSRFSWFFTRLIVPLPIE